MIAETVHMLSFYAPNRKSCERRRRRRRWSNNSSNNTNW
jgi:hypothetical protein